MPYREGCSPRPTLSPGTGRKTLVLLTPPDEARPVLALGIRPKQLGHGRRKIVNRRMVVAQFCNGPALASRLANGSVQPNQGNNLSREWGRKSS